VKRPAKAVKIPVRQPIGQQTPGYFELVYYSKFFPCWLGVAWLQNAYLTTICEHDVWYHRGMMISDGPGGAGPSFFCADQARQPANMDPYLAMAVGAAAGTLLRHSEGDPLVRDLPLGAVAIDTRTGVGYPGVCLDYETGDGGDHAEKVAIDAAAREGVKPEHLHVVSTFEPCRQCVDMMADQGIQEVTYVSGREVGERQGIMRPGRSTAPQITAQRREQGLPHSCLHQVVDPAWQAACEALLTPFSRDTDRDPGAEVLHFHPDRVDTQLNLLQTILGPEAQRRHHERRLPLTAAAEFITGLFVPATARA
jgi:tRNA(Arg) A34 adenosine deaminase TadA